VQRMEIFQRLYTQLPEKEVSWCDLWQNMYVT
jgi:hypothetical protein